MLNKFFVFIVISRLTGSVRVTC